MIRFKLFFFILFGCILLAGCTKEDLPYAEEEVATTYLQVYIPRTEVKSRTIGTPTTPGSEGESAISDITIYLANNDKVVKITNITISNTSNSYTSDLIPVEADILNQEFQVFVVANPTKANFSIRTSLDFRGLYSTQEDTYKLLTLGQIVMSNQTEQSPAPTITITKENTRENPAQVRVLLDRLAVKIEPQVSVDFKANFSNSSKENAFFKDFIFTVEAAGLLNATTEFNLEQQWSDGANGQPIQLLSPSWNYKPEEEYLNRYYNTIKDYTNTDTPPFISFNEVAEAGFRPISSPFYCLENNSPFYDYSGSSITPENQIKTKYKGLTTGVIFKIQAIKDNNASTFYRYEGKFFSDTETDRKLLSEIANLNSGDFSNIAILRAKGVKVYENGNIYYTYWIKDKNTAYSGDEYDLSYAIIRNSYYILRILGLTTVGDDVPGGGYEPDEPIDKVEEIEIAAICQDWTLVDVTHEFN